MVQYIFSGEEHNVIVKSHGNAKYPSSYKRMLSSTRDKLKKSVLDKTKMAKASLDAVYHSSGDVTKARSLGELPRGPTDLYNARHAGKSSIHSNVCENKEGQSSHNTSVALSLDNVWTLLERAKREEEESKDCVFVRECTIHPDFFVVLANERQVTEVKKFCTNQSEFSIFGIDPTFNIFYRNISITP